MHYKLLLLFLLNLLGLAYLRQAQAQNATKPFTLVLDAGHGGHDPGAIGTYAKEKHINLNVALALGKLVEANCLDVRVIYTRKTDVFVPLDERARIANRAKADLFISIHTNALPKGRQAYGAETYTLGIARAAANLEVAKRENAVILVEENYKERYAGFNPNLSESYIIFELMQDQYMKQSVSLAGHLQKQYVHVAGRQDKGVHQAGFLVLRNTSMPSVLTELGFISTPDEERFLSSDEGIQKMAHSIYQGFVDYRKGTSPSTPAVKPLPTAVPKEETREEPSAPPVSPTAEDKSSPAVQNKEPEAAAEASGIVFKLQILTSSQPLPAGSPRFQGVRPIDSYAEGNLHKYTCGSTAQYAEIVALRKSVADKFPDCFVIAFKNGEKIALQQAIREAKTK